MASWEILPLEIMTDILARLPVLSLIRLTTVSKQFSAIIKSQNFDKLHFSYSTKNNRLSLFAYILGSGRPLEYSEGDQREVYVDFSNSNWKSYWYSFPYNKYTCSHVEGICNGVVLIVAHQTYGPRPNLPVLILWNPATQKSKKLPLPHPHVINHGWYSCKAIKYGFGCDNNGNDFKVVQFCSTICHRAPHVSNADVYSFNTGAWKRQDDVLPEGFYKCRHVHVNGILFWLGWNDSDDEFILSFDLSKEVFTTVTVPMTSISTNNSKQYRKFWRLSVYEDDSLALLTAGNPTLDDIVLWVMKRDSGRSEHTDIWVKMHSLRLQPKNNIVGDSQRRDTVYGFWNKYVIVKSKILYRRVKRVYRLHLLDITNGNVICNYVRQKRHCSLIKNWKPTSKYPMETQDWKPRSKPYVNNYAESLFPVCKDEDEIPLEIKYNPKPEVDASTELINKNCQAQTPSTDLANKFKSGKLWKMLKKTASKLTTLVMGLCEENA